MNIEPVGTGAALLQTALGLIQASESVGVPLRLCGGLACWLRSGETAKGFALSAGRDHEDFDLIAYHTHRKRVIALLKEAGFYEESATATVPGIRRTKFSSAANGLRGEVFYDALDFCHHIDVRGRLEAEPITLPLAELLLQKLQVVELTPKDIVDVQMLLFDFDFGETDEGAFSIPRIAGLCGSDWGLFHTTGISIEKVSAATMSAPYLNEQQRGHVLDRLNRLQRALDEAPKSLRWRTRALIGDRVRWYEKVEEDDDSL